MTGSRVLCPRGALVRGVCALALLARLSSPPLALPELPLGIAAALELRWMAGAWIERRHGVVIEEHWMAPESGVMVGMNRATREDGSVFFEFLRIAPSDAGLSYFASPLGRPATEFPLVSLDSLEGKRVIFENRSHDFPQRIIYWLDESGGLHSRIEGRVDGKLQAEEWHWSRLGG